MSLLDRRVQLMWNGRTVLLGASTSAVAYTTLVQHLDQFGGLTWREWRKANIGDARLFGRIVAGERIVLEYRDDTGHAQALIEAL